MSGQQASSASAPPIRALIVEDSEDDVALVLRTLRQGGLVFEHTVVADAHAFATALDTDGWDLILADYALPGFNGGTALRMVRERALDVPFILVSGTVGEELAVEAMKAGAADYVMKDNLQRLVPVIDRELRETAGRRAAEQERETLQAQLHQAQKLEAIGTLAGGVAHDFNNLLVVIRGNAELIARASSGPDEDEHVLEVLQATRRAEQLINQLLAFSRRQPRQKEPVVLGAIVDDVVSMLRRVLESEISIRVEHTKDLPPIYASVTSIEQVIMNLATNARDAMPGGGTLTIRTDLHVMTPGVAATGRYVVLSVADTGEGIENAILDSIFDPFFTTKPTGKGTGLGLSTAYGIAKDHQGWVTVESQVGVGTTFRVFLPVIEGAVTKGSPQIAEVLVQASSPARILVVEDEKSVRLLTVAALSRQRHRVTGVGSCADARAAVASSREPYDLVICDVGLPDGSGLALLAGLLRQYKNLRGLVASGYARQIAPDGLDQQRVAYLPKPFGLTDLLTKVAQVLRNNESG